MGTKKINTVSDLSPAPYNPRKISDQDLEELRAAMQTFGDLSGIVVNVASGNLIGGHQRVKIFDPSWPIEKRAQRDDVGTLAVGTIQTPYGNWTYREVDWPPVKEKMANIAANKHGGEWDFPMLKDLLTEIDTGEYDFDLTGFDDREMANIFAGYEAELSDLPNISHEDTRTMTVISFSVTMEQKSMIDAALNNVRQTECLDAIEGENLNGKALVFIFARQNVAS